MKTRTVKAPNTTAIISALLVNINYAFTVSLILMANAINIAMCVPLCNVVVCIYVIRFVRGQVKVTVQTPLQKRLKLRDQVNQ